jgi:hypothetical protein
MRSDFEENDCLAMIIAVFQVLLPYVLAGIFAMLALIWILFFV